MRVTRNTIHVAFARMLDDQIEPGAMFAYRDLVDDWADTGLRNDDLDRVLESLFASGHLDRSVVGKDTWYRLTAAGAIELRVVRSTLWERLRDRLTLLRARLRTLGGEHRPAAKARRTTDRIASETP
ncbi:hypothetical protein AAG565_02380 [Fontimonas sp. SYSU GA230001]|uniref:hypothetical protein n=1 Tax=Fontimonas sp. SYSU GA230001 TaxID=3142450 RepID=UPI0032B4D4B2